MISPLAGSQRPAGDDAERQHEHQQNGARYHRHQRLHDELGVSQVRVAIATNLVSKLIRLRAPMLRDAASEKRMLCSNIVRHMRYRRKNIGNEKIRSTGIRADTE